MSFFTNKYIPRCVSRVIPVIRKALIFISLFLFIIIPLLRADEPEEQPGVKSETETEMYRENGTDTESETRKGIEFSFSPGYTVPLWGGYADWGREVVSGGISFTARSFFGEFSAADDINLDYGAELGFIPLHRWDYSDSEGRIWNSNYSVIPFFLLTRYRLGSIEDAAFMYLTGGVGVYHWRWSYRYHVFDENTGESARISSTDKKTVPGVTAGLGLWFQLERNLHCDLLLRWTSAYPVIMLHMGLGRFF